MIKAIIFDFDGTLVNTIDGIYNTWVKTFNLLKKKPPTIHMLRSAFGQRREILVKQIMGNETKETYKKACNIYSDLYDSNAILASPYNGIKKMLNDLHLLGLKIAIGTNKPYLHVNNIIMKIFNKEQSVIDFIVCPNKYVKGKPSPEIFSKCAKMWGLSPEEVVVIGDTVFDLIAAKEAGMKSIAVAWGYGNSKILKTYKPEYFAKRPNHITLFIQANYLDLKAHKASSIDLTCCNH